MTQERYDEICKQEGAIQLGHPEFDEHYHKNIWNGLGLTAVICQRKTFEVTRLCIESLQRFYPDLNILVVDGNSEDNSTIYLRYKALCSPNFKVYERIGKRHSHGESIHDAVINHVNTPYVLTMDSDTITNRGGWIEQLLNQFKENPNLYSTGSLMLVTRKGYGCGTPEGDNDILRYTHPSCGIFHVPTYKQLNVAWNDNGAPLAHNMIAAEKAGFEVGSFPIDKYVSHRMGSTWVTEHQIIWKDDYDVFIRPFVSFVITKQEQIISLEKQSDKDFNISVQSENINLKIWEGETKDISNRMYGIRFTVNGEYVCVLNENVSSIYEEFVHDAKLAIIESNAADEIEVGGLRLVKRKIWQNKDCLQ